LPVADVIEVSAAPIDTAALQLSLQNAAAGGLCVFEGWVRNENEGHVVERLEYEAHEPLVIVEGEKVLEEARQKFSFLEARCVHRVGVLEIGECAVWIGVASAHRDEAFRACRYIIDEIKLRLPIWKKEHYADGDSGWINCERCAHHGERDC
jgi:molybdopterin synthase catalytic subunit